MEGEWNGTERRSVSWEEVVAHMAATNVKLENMNTSINGLTDKVGKQNGRIATLETKADVYQGYFKAVVAIGTGVISLLGILVAWARK